MKHLRTPLAIAALLSAFAVHAQAPAGGPPPGATPMPMQGASGMPGGPGGMHGRMMDPARMQQFHEQRLAALKQALQLTPAQEGAWTTFAAAMRPAQAPGTMRAEHEALAKLTTPERIERMKALRQQHQAEMDRRAQATLTFYGTLDAEQKKRFDAQTARHFGGRRGDGPGQHPGHHHHHHG